ncbi:PRLI-interacting factor A [Quillaja saponaria]|uniref:PRLI-interacting factor A n=1 Tax=Quillaja saponaria TaxID=32244 RepID=A0AAD7VNL0_QUISA|nr:PRLI-interacting factor A [Quillaja saponaria]
MNEQSRMLDQSQILQNQNYFVWPSPPLPPGSKSDKRREIGRTDPLGLGNFFKPSNLNDMQSQIQNRLKGRRFHPKKNFNTGFAPRNTTSFLIRAKKAGEVLVDTAKEEGFVNGYGAMEGLIQLRSPKGDDEEEDCEYGSTDSDVEDHLEVERRLDHDLSRFEMIYPSVGGGGYEQSSALVNRVDDQDTHLVQLEEENLTVKEKLFLMERELFYFRRRVHCLEINGGQQYHSEKMSENGFREQ